jgi:type IV secretory pathway VirB2 component (pilin)
MMKLLAKPGECFFVVVVMLTYAGLMHWFGMKPLDTKGCLMVAVVFIVMGIVSRLCDMYTIKRREEG